MTLRKFFSSKRVCLTKVLMDFYDSTHLIFLCLQLKLLFDILYTHISLFFIHFNHTFLCNYMRKLTSNKIIVFYDGHYLFYLFIYIH